jgi:hypothetical protein
MISATNERLQLIEGANEIKGDTWGKDRSTTGCFPTNKQISREKLILAGFIFYYFLLLLLGNGNNCTYTGHPYNK